MLLSEIFNALTTGELSQVHIGGAEEQGITVANQAKLLPHINLGLTELHKRFLLREGRVKVQLVEGRHTYVLDRKYAVSNRESFGVAKYILDSADEPFLNDIHKIERVYNDNGCEVLLNAGIDMSDPTVVNVRTLSHNTLMIPPHLTGSYITVVYRANHPQIVTEDGSFDPEEVEVNLPYSHLEPLLFYVASRIMNPIGLGGEFHEGNNYAMKFEAACQVLENQSLRLDVGGPNTRLYRAGWV